MRYFRFFFKLKPRKTIEQQIQYDQIGIKYCLDQFQQGHNFTIFSP